MINYDRPGLAQQGPHQNYDNLSRPPLVHLGPDQNYDKLCLVWAGPARAKDKS